MTFLVEIFREQPHSGFNLENWYRFCAIKLFEDIFMPDHIEPDDPCYSEPHFDDLAPIIAQTFSANIQIEEDPETHHDPVELAEAVLFATAKFLLRYNYYSHEVGMFYKNIGYYPYEFLIHYFPEEKWNRSLIQSLPIPLRHLVQN